MKIGYDARLIDETGIGRYIKNTLPYLTRSTKNKWYILIRKSERPLLENILKNQSNVKIIEFNYRWHSIAEQIFLPLTLYKLKLDVFHTPYINTPVFYFKKKAVTIHDLTVLTNKTGKASTKNIFYYLFKQFGYKIALKSALRADTIFTVTNTVKEDILNFFPKTNKNKIIVTYNGYTKLGISRKSSVINYCKNSKPYFFYIGNAHPHKNLEFLVTNFDKFCNVYKKYNIVIAGRNDFFMKRILNLIDSLPNKEHFYYFESPTDLELGLLYKNSVALVLPSLKEGFGLQILEAMSANIPIICSKIPVYKEVSNNLAIYFDPTSSRSFLIALAKCLKISSRELKDLSKKYAVQLKKFSWKETAIDTLRALENKQTNIKTLKEKVY